MNPPPPWRLRIHDTLPSTQDLCRRLAEAGEPGHLAVLARRQTAGRGTRGRLWSSPVGNLSLSLLLRPREPTRDASQWSLLTAVALQEVLAGYIPDPERWRLKWPNDVLLDGGKIAGILAESGADRGMLDWLVIGVGVNLASAPPVPDRPTSCLADLVTAPDPLDFAHRLLAALTQWRDRRARDGFAPVHAAWLAHAPRPGAALSLRLPGRVVEGGFAGLAADGALLLEVGGRVRAFAAGEI